MAEMKRVAERLELVTNICVIGAVLVFVFSVGWFALRHGSSIRIPSSSIKNGTRLTISEWDWAISPQTLVLVLSADCKYCTASAPFYRRLVSQGALTHGTRFLAILPQAPDKSKEYLAKLEVMIDDLRQAPPASVGATGTPTLILVNGSGVVIHSWEGLLPPDAETEILAYVK
jgi:thioredoxin-related protein